MLAALSLLFVLGAQAPAIPAEEQAPPAAEEASPDPGAEPAEAVDGDEPAAPPEATGGDEAAPATPRSRVLVLHLEAQGVEGPVAETLTAVVVQELSRQEALNVISGKDLRDLVAVRAERRQLEGECDSDSCLAEVAAAMGARYVVSGQVGRLGQLTVVSLSLFDAEAGTAVDRERIELLRLEEATRRLGPHVHNLVAPLVGTEKVETPPPPDLDRPGDMAATVAAEPDTTSTLGLFTSLTMVAGVCLAAGAGVLGTLAYFVTVGGTFATLGLRPETYFSLLPIAGPLLHIGMRQELDFPSRLVFWTSFGFQAAPFVAVILGLMLWGGAWYLSPDDDDAPATPDAAWLPSPRDKLALDAE